MAALVRRVRADEWRELRDLRLSALAGAPQAFGTTLASARVRGDSDWQDAARRGEGTDAWVTFVADEDGTLVGMASGLRENDVDELIQMWVEPRARRRGVGTALGEAVVDWAAGRNAPLVRLAVNPDEPGAVALYRSLGFRDTVRRDPDLFHGRPGLAMIMERVLPRGASLRTDSDTVDR
jgi:GNAT superfamily N-acetyltransferase